ncbi:alpha-hydroxy acid oxidase [Halomonas sp. G11]|jgi:L-lactate dehydrogenase (cytochrome)|uniref:alpha-hydroxy acid oxidase n=1 Tax=Halomonas sp. G11 TaxID=1684425 RepID=UPI0008013926|nr:alpha-hydroxy acid oxidase [Halomonas sp. G11]OBA00746.1 alpha-hydroxy-acid oxidizing enzyme [Halomonas sp. G11]
MPVYTNIEDLRRRYARRTPKMFYDYAESGSWTEQTFRENTSDFQHIHLKQRVAVDMSGRTTRNQMIGEDVSMPVALAPVGLTGMQSADGEIKAARAAEKFGVPYTLSTMSICSIEDVAEHTTKPFWFQVYTLKDDDFMRRLIERARAANCSAIVVTVDLQVLGQRHKDIKNGLSAPPKLTPRSIANMATKIPWGLEMLQTKRRSFGNIVGHAKGVTDPSSLSTWTAEAFDVSLDWNRIAQFKEWWGGKLIVKGIMAPEDARRAAEIGADAIVVSNHGGRQLDGAMSSIRMLPAIMDAVGDKVEVHLDSGIRSGQDVLKALALGAKGTYIGRAYTYGLGAAGEAGVTRALEIIHKELDTTMALCGETDTRNLGEHNLYVPQGFGDPTVKL